MSFAGWYALDIFFILLCCYFVIRGCFRGFVGELITFAGFFLGLYLSFKFSGVFGRILAHAAGINEYAAQVLAIVIVWLVISLLAAALRAMTRALLSAISLGGLDRILGLFSGVIKTVAVIYVFMIAGFLLAPVLSPEWMAESSALMYAGKEWPAVRKLLIDMEALPKGTSLPDGTLDRILKPYLKNKTPASAHTEAARAWDSDLS